MPKETLCWVSIVERCWGAWGPGCLAGSPGDPRVSSECNPDFIGRVFALQFPSGPYVFLVGVLPADSVSDLFRARAYRQIRFSDFLSRVHTGGRLNTMNSCSTHVRLMLDTQLVILSVSANFADGGRWLHGHMHIYIYMLYVYTYLWSCIYGSVSLIHDKGK